MEQHEKSREFNSLLEHLRRWDSEELFDAQEAVEQLTRHPGWKVVTGLVDALTRAGYSTLKMANGRLEQAEYAAVLGKLAGLEVLAQVPEAVSLTAERAEKRLEQANAEMAGVE
jgi:hypothetical protein